MTKINLEMARELLDRAVQTQGPDFVYNPWFDDEVTDNGCYYQPVTYEKSPKSKRITGCLIGVALDLAGFTFQHGQNKSIMELWYKNADSFTRAAAEYFLRAQFSQDNGDSWGFARGYAEEGLTDIRHAYQDV